MKWIEILRDGRYALLRNVNDTQFVVAWDYDPDGEENKQWSGGEYFSYWQEERKSYYLSKAIDFFRMRTEPDYIPRGRLEELATKFKDKMTEFAIECNVSDADFEYELEEFDLEDYEREFFGLHELREEDDEW